MLELGLEADVRVASAFCESEYLTDGGTSCCFVDSGHGSQIKDTDGDEKDGWDEGALPRFPNIKVQAPLRARQSVLFPVDYRQKGVIIDDVSRLCRSRRSNSVRSQSDMGGSKCMP